MGKKKKARALVICKNNPAVNCYAGSNCNKCGWDPQVSRERLAQYNAKKGGKRG